MDFEWLSLSTPPSSFYPIVPLHERIKKKNIKLSPWPYLFVSVGTWWKANAVVKLDTWLVAQLNSKMGEVN